jgi:DNA-binding LacI/PurR family transcriptional regulator
MSIQKIARLAGVSVATVSRVLNNSDTVKAKNRERVLQAIKESNYQPNLLARQLRTARSNMILVMVSNIANPFAPRWSRVLKKRRKRTATGSCCVIPVRI